MPALRDLFDRLVDHADQRLPAGFYAAISVPTARTRERLRARHKAFIDPDRSEVPAMVDVDATATWVISQSKLNYATLGGIAAVGGWASVPPEALASAMGVVRLGQRLAVVYGFDPETDKGQMALWRALASGLEMELPSEGPMQVRLRDLPAVLAPQPVSAGTYMARQVLTRQAYAIATRFTRLIPLVSPILSASRSHSRMHAVGERMRDVFRRLAEIPAEMRFVEDAVEVP